VGQENIVLRGDIESILEMQGNTKNG